MDGSEYHTDEPSKGEGGHLGRGSYQADGQGWLGQAMRRREVAAQALSLHYFMGF